MSSSEKTLETAKKGAKVHSIPIDLDLLPEDLARAFIESQKPYRHDAAARKRISDSRRAGIAKRKAEWMRRAEAKARKGAYKTDSGMGAKLLALAGDWITSHELRIQLNTYPGFLRCLTDRLWRCGQLLKRKNPAWCGKPGWGQGVERCMYQYKRLSQVHDAPQGNQHESR